jgi:polysaccharide deacetylase family sporulation protein PdaB
MKKIISGMLVFFLIGLILPDMLAAAPKNRKYFESRGEVIWEVPTDQKVIAITFDDGPHPKDTPKILDILKQYNAKATFFAIGRKVEQFPELALREVAEGHEIANHTYNHIYFGNGISKEKIIQEIVKSQNAIYSVTGQQPKFFRPPGGYYNEKIVNAAKEAGFQVVMWSWHQDTFDWRTPGVEKIVNRVLRNAKKGDIILFHDYVRGKSQTIEALTKILPELQKRGFHFVTVSELLTYRKSEPVKSSDL